MSNFYQNIFHVAGRMTQKPELRVANNGDSVTTFTIAVKRAAASKLRGEKEPITDFFKIVAWKDKAEEITKFFDKGDSISITAHVQNRSYEKDGIKYYSTEVICDSWSFVDSLDEKEERRKRNSASIADNTNAYYEELQNTYKEPPAIYEKPSDFVETGDDELPF